MPKDSLPYQVSFTIFKSKQVLIIRSSRVSEVIEARDVKPEADHTNTSEKGPALEPTLRVNVVESPIGVSFKRSFDWETMRSIFFGENTECIHYIWNVSWHPRQNILLGIPELGVVNSFFKSCQLVVVFAYKWRLSKYACENLPITLAQARPIHWVPFFQYWVLFEKTYNIFLINKNELIR